MSENGRPKPIIKVRPLSDLENFAISKLDLSLTICEDEGTCQLRIVERDFDSVQLRCLRCGYCIWLDV